MKPPFPSNALRGWLLTAFMLMVHRMATAQESLRNSLAGDAAAAAQRQQQSLQNYTFKEGDFRLLVVPSMEVDWNDNVNLTRSNAESDFILEPFVQLTGSYALTQRNLLSLSVGVGYYDYVRTVTNSGLRLASDSLVSFDTYIKDVAINFHDRFSLTEDSSTESAVAGTSQYGNFINTAGLTAIWDLEDIVLTLGYDHLNSVSSTAEFNYLDRSAELPLARVGLHLRPDLTAGVEASAGFTTYEQAVLNNNNSYSAGVYADWNPGSYLRVQPRVGYTIYDFQNTSQSSQTFFAGNTAATPEGVPIITKNLNTWYADLTVTHLVTKAINYGFSAGHEIRLGIESDTVEDYYFRPNINWMIIKDLGVNTTGFYEHGNQGVGNVTGNLVETYNWFGGGLTLSYPLMKRLLLSLTYRLTLRSSTIPTQEYSQNLVGLRLTYQLP